MTRTVCGHCNLPNRVDGHDACLGTIPGVMNACCGHGDVRCAYVQFRPEDAPEHPGQWHCCCVDGHASEAGMCLRCGDERTFRIAGEEVFLFLRAESSS